MYVYTVDAGYKNTGYKNISDIRTSFGETDSLLYMCIENIPVIRTSNIGYKNISDIRTYSLIPDNVLITGIDCIYIYIESTPLHRSLVKLGPPVNRVTWPRTKPKE